MGAMVTPAAWAAPTRARGTSMMVVPPMPDFPEAVAGVAAMAPAPAMSATPAATLTIFLLRFMNPPGVIISRPLRGLTAAAWAFLREAQTQTLALPNTGQALAIDLGSPTDIHPTNKQDVGRRLALLAKNRVYGVTGDDTGPTFSDAGREGPALRVRFTHASGLNSRDKPTQSLELAGADKVFHPATAKIERESLLVSSPAVKDPVAVRYAWRNAPAANLFNGAGLPAVPFRSDRW